MITPVQIESLLLNLEKDYRLKLVFPNDWEIMIDNTDTIEASADDTAIFVCREDGKRVLLNLEKVMLVCETKRFI